MVLQLVGQLCQTTDEVALPMHSVAQQAEDHLLAEAGRYGSSTLRYMCSMHTVEARPVVIAGMMLEQQLGRHAGGPQSKCNG